MAQPRRLKSSCLDDDGWHRTSCPAPSSCVRCARGRGVRSHAGFEMASSRAALGHVAKTYQDEILDVVASDARWASWAETFATSVCRVPVRRHASTFERRVPVIFGLRPVERDARLGARRQQERHPRRDSVICASASDRRDAERGSNGSRPWSRTRARPRILRGGRLVCAASEATERQRDEATLLAPSCPYAVRRTDSGSVLA